MVIVTGIPHDNDCLPSNRCAQRRDRPRFPNPASWSGLGSRRQPGSAMTGFSRAPILSISTRTVSPAFRYVPGRCQAMPFGVPVDSTSPTSRVNALDRYETCS